MRVLLFNSSGTGQKADVFEMGNVFPRIGIASIAVRLLGHGQGVKIIDPEVQTLNPNQVKNEVRRFKPDIVGFTVYIEEVHQAAYQARLFSQDALYASPPELKQFN